MELISVKDLEQASSIFQGKTGNAFARAILKLCAVDKINTLYTNNEQFTGGEFASHILEDIKVDYRIGNVQRLDSLPEGSFITISNHPYGSIDGVIIVDLFSRLYPEFKVLVNKFLARIEALGSNFITVTPTGEEKTAATQESILGIKRSFAQIKAGRPLGLFPSGAVSDMSLKEGCIRDREWQDGIIKFIKKAKVPILPVRFFDRNSLFFYNLGLIDWKIRLLRLHREVFNKANKNVRLGLGKLISVEEQNRITDMTQFKQYLRSSVYDMAMPDKFIHQSEYFKLEFNL